LPDKKIQDTLIKLLKSGHEVEVPASGLSMFPLLLPGDKLLVSPGRIQIGDIGVFISNKILIAHRLYKIENELYFFKGDGLIYPDQPINASNVIGIVKQRKRGNNIKNCKSFSFRAFKKCMPHLSFITGRFFFYCGRIYWRLFIKDK